MKCVIYCRVSTDRQREAGTIESQREVLLQFARANDWTVVSVEEDDGFSGTVPAWDRPGMRRVLGFVERREVDALLVVDVDRTSRAEDPLERALVRKALRDNNAVLATPKGILADVTPEEKLTQDMLSSIASYERSKIKERTLRGRKDHVLRKGGRPPTHIPIGWSWDPNIHACVVAPDEMPVVQEVFRLAAQGQGPLQIERALIRNGVSSGRQLNYRPRGAPKGAPRRAERKYLVRQTIASMVANESYFSGVWAPVPAWDSSFTLVMQPLVSRELWEAANAGVRSRPHPPPRPLKYHYLLRAVARCAHCQRNLRGQTHSKNHNAYYRCEAAARAPANSPLCTGRGGIRADALEAVVWGYVQRLILEPSFLRSEVERAVDADLKGADSVADSARQLRAAVERLAQERGRALTAHRKGLCTEAELALQLGEIEAERLPLLNRLELVGLRERTEGAKATRLAAVEGRLRSMREAVRTLDRDEQRAIIAELIDAVVVDTVTSSVEIHVLVAGAGAMVGGDGDGSGSSGPSSPRRGSNRAKGEVASGGYGVGNSPGRATRPRRVGRSRTRRTVWRWCRRRAWAG